MKPLYFLIKHDVTNESEAPTLRQAFRLNEIVGHNIVGVDFTQKDHPLFIHAYRRLQSRVGLP